MNKGICKDDKSELTLKLNQFEHQIFRFFNLKLSNDRMGCKFKLEKVRERLILIARFFV